MANVLVEPLRCPLCAHRGSLRLLGFREQLEGEIELVLNCEWCGSGVNLHCSLEIWNRWQDQDSIWIFPTVADLIKFMTQGEYKYADS